MKTSLAFVVAFILGSLGTSIPPRITLAAEVEEPTSASADTAPHLAVYLITFGPGEHPFFRFGHNAIWVADRSKGTNDVYNWGTFNFDTIWLIPEFIKGRFQYWLSVDDMSYTVRAYRSEGRSVLAQELALNGDEKRQIVAMLEENAKPENAKYRYDYYLDNCSTRPRDVIDRVTGGVLKATSKGPARYNFRQHTMRMTADLWWEYVGLDLILGDFVDKPISVWEEMFLPEVLAETARQAVRRDGVPLVKREKVLTPQALPPPPAAPPERTAYMAAIGLAASAVVFLAGRRRGWPWRLLLAIAAAKMALLGSIAAFMSWLTDHHACHHNENALAISPLLALLVWPLLRGYRSRLSTTVAKLVIVGAILSFAVKVLPWFDQDTWRIAFLFAPVSVALAVTALHHPEKRS